MAPPCKWSGFRSGTSRTGFSLSGFSLQPRRKSDRLKPVLLRSPQLSSTWAQSLPEKFPSQQSHAAMEFSRRAPGLLQHGWIEQQRNASNEGRLLFRRLPTLATFRCHLLPRGEIRVQR